MGMSSRLTRFSVLVVALVVAGCGFKPLYGEKNEGGGVTADLSTVRIQPISDRVGQILRNELIDRMNPSGEPGDGKYTLEVKLAVTKQELGIRIDETATRANMQFASSFQLRENSSGAIVYKSNSAATTSYNIVNSDYGTISAERDARKRGVVLIADSITTRLAAYFNRLRSLRRKQ